MRVVVVATLVSLCFVAEGSETATGDHMRLKEAVEDLGGEDFLAATAATRTIFDGGSKSFDYLVARFDDESEFKGFCGRRMLESQTIPFQPNAEAEHRVGDGVCTVREVSLFLLVAILRDNFYFADSCNLRTRDSDSPDELTAALRELEYIHQQERLELRVVAPVLHAHGLSFSGEQ